MPNELTDKDHKRIARLIVERKANLQQRSGELSTWLLEYKGTIYRITYNELQRAIVTVLPMETPDLAKAHRDNPFAELLEIRGDLPPMPKPRQRGRGRRKKK
ncbi:MAG: hypothetical protein AMS21_01080 [Gemmatimonas sp. SG8_38_2]|nr:MAG: hypothetical protein AMS21_01080 [Gemmatimonas sp. SG8_38_2]